ncbi:hypothetical protein [Celerinatantimonas sp. YJH-8]|uniref:hypothetical protein n=1 Tax=Celerinatantimonas sp. YJH-8 TaxID=3228714 RepID=UPI0038C53811
MRSLVMITIISTLFLQGCNGYPPPLDPKRFDNTTWRATSPFDSHNYLQFTLYKKNNLLALYGKGGCHKITGVMRIEGIRLYLATPLYDSYEGSCTIQKDRMIKLYISAIKAGLIFDSGDLYTSDGGVAFFHRPSQPLKTPN